MKNSIKSFMIGGFAVLVASSSLMADVTSAQSDSDILQKIEETAKVRKEIVEIIKSGNGVTLRISAFEEAVKSRDP